MSVTHKRVLDHLALLVEEYAHEMPVTLIVQGAVITGMLTPLRFYHDWVARAAEFAKETGVTVRYAEDADPLSPAAREQRREEWAEAFPRGSEPPDLPQVALRNATVRMAGSSYRVQALLINADTVAAVTYGVLTDPPEPNGDDFDDDQDEDSDDNNQDDEFDGIDEG